MSQEHSTSNEPRAEQEQSRAKSRARVEQEQEQSRAEQSKSKSKSKSRARARATSQEQSKSKSNLPSEEELIFRRRHANGRRPGDVTQAVRQGVMRAGGRVTRAAA